MRFPSLLLPLSLALPSTALNILLPLYLYPGDSGSAWGDVFSTISSHPDVQFEVVVNPNSGPGTTGFPTDQNIISGIAKLNSYSNVHTVGYVETEHGSRDTSAVNADVDTYAKWAGYSGANIAIGGIYFDDVSSETTSAMYSYYETVSEHVRSSFSSGARVVFNPGYRIPAQYFSYADTIVEFEDSYANYQSEGIIAQIPTQFRAKSALQIYSTPEGADLSGLISAMVQAGIEYVYFGEDCCYKVWSNTLLHAMANAV